MNEQAKRAAAREAVAEVRAGMTIGLGSGSTAAWVVRELGAMRLEGLRAVPTSTATAALAREVGIELLGLQEVAGELALTIDGADEVDAHGALVKGGGGALLREKIVAAASRRLVIVIDDSKEVETLGDFGLPVEVIAFGRALVERAIEALGGRAQLRRRDSGEPWITDEGHALLDCDFGPIDDPGGLGAALSRVPGVVEHGLFVQMAETVIIGSGEGTVRRRAWPQSTPRRAWEQGGAAVLFQGEPWT